MKWELIFDDLDSALYTLNTTPISFEIRREDNNQYTLGISTYDISLKLITIEACSIENAIFSFSHLIEDIFAVIANDFRSSCTESIDKHECYRACYE